MIFEAISGSSPNGPALSRKEIDYLVRKVKKLQKKATLIQKMLVAFFDGMFVSKARNLFDLNNILNGFVDFWVGMKKDGLKIGVKVRSSQY